MMIRSKIDKNDSISAQRKLKIAEGRGTSDREAGESGKEPTCSCYSFDRDFFREEIAEKYTLTAINIRGWSWRRKR
ncbi:hypothetical protein L6164_016318 [Bauhinia variegata]|uniref:Uncharacterized protein n=1 Tax=Bauhinia variegata TaxID=167791 RepID=A0ACB9NP20_BAUVA|nr:hypothetical protein L6164_016318 [Bauhinia variegata]